jgi:hypothetical protein
MDVLVTFSVLPAEWFKEGDEKWKSKNGEFWSSWVDNAVIEIEEESATKSP